MKAVPGPSVFRSLPMRPVTLAGVLLLFLATGPAAAQRTEPLPAELADVGITEQLNGQLPLAATFVDDRGDSVTLGSYFDGQRPVILNLGYFACPMLCGLVTNALMDALRGMKWTPGQEFEVITLSFDPTESALLAREKKDNYLRQLGRPEAGDGWHFLVGAEDDIAAVTGATGFRYRWVEKQAQFAHAAALIVCTPEGRVARYLYGIEYDPQTLRLSLLEAAEGRAATSLDRVLLFCFQYDATKGRYAPAAMNLMRAGGLVTLVVLGGFGTRAWRRAGKRRPSGS